jgi:NAD(P)-dependent dehydrogenase (short-subunit alcohol dehydrogenase family)
MYTQPLDVVDPEYTRGVYSGTTAYARTKRMEVHLAECWAPELAPERVTVHSMHPGWADTPGVQTSLPVFRRVTGPFLRSDQQGADTTVWLLAAPEARESTGLFWHDRRPRATSYLSRTRPTPDQVHRLWELVVAATGVPAERA